jgi:hypothetical protein
LLRSRQIFYETVIHSSRILGGIRIENVIWIARSANFTPGIWHNEIDWMVGANNDTASSMYKHGVLGIRVTCHFHETFVNDYLRFRSAINNDTEFCPSDRDRSRGSIDPVRVGPAAEMVDFHPNTPQQNLKQLPETVRGAEIL